MLMLFVLHGCGSPAARFQRQAERQGLQHVEGPLVIYQNGEFVDGKPIHIYFDGDGTPALGRGRITLDPTSRKRIILDLIQADPATSALIGRPCYYGKRDDCDPRMWTTGRYSEDVIAQMTTAIQTTVAACPSSPLILIGYSGGGSLAMLIAPRVKQVVAIVTVAANLDTEAWVAHHGYAPLADSLNPANQKPLDGSIRQYHYFGERDDNVPPELMRGVVERQENASLEIVAGFDHECCWARIWPETMKSISAKVSAGAR